MINLDIEKLIPNIICEDLSLNKRTTYISQLTILTIKSLLPLEDAVGNEIDYKRFEEELKLWRQYYIGEEVPSLCTFKKFDKIAYLNSFDDTFYTILIPIVISNTEFIVLEEELIKNILYFSPNMEDLFEWLLIGLVIYFLINKDEDIINRLKEYVINLSQVDFIAKYGQYFSAEAKDISNSFKISFEKKRIDLLNILNGIESKGYAFLQDLLMIIDNKEPKTSLGRVIYRSCNDFQIAQTPIFYMNMNKYILKLRKGRIDIEDLKIKDYILPDIFDFKEGEEFYHSLLNHSKVIKKEASPNGLTSLVSTKSGNYLFKRDPF